MQHTGRYGKREECCIDQLNSPAMPDDQQLVVQLLFMKNMAIVGGLLVIAGLGTGPASVDARTST